MFRRSLPFACAALACAGLPACAQTPPLSAKDFPPQPAEIDLSQIVPWIPFNGIASTQDKVALVQQVLQFDPQHPTLPSEPRRDVIWALPETTPLLHLTFRIGRGDNSVSDDSGHVFQLPASVPIFWIVPNQGTVIPAQVIDHVEVTRGVAQVTIRRYQTHLPNEEPKTIVTEAVPTLRVALQSESGAPFNVVPQFAREAVGKQTQYAPITLPRVAGRYLIEYRDNNGTFIGAVEDGVYADPPVKPGEALQYQIWQLPVYRDEQGQQLPQPIHPTIPTPVLEPVAEQVAPAPAPPVIKQAQGPETWLHAEPFYGAPPAPSGEPYHGGVAPKLLAP